MRLVRALLMVAPMGTMRKAMEMEQEGIKFAADRMSKIGGGLKRADDQIIEFVKEKPVTALCAALALGYVMGRVLTRLS